MRARSQLPSHQAVHHRLNTSSRPGYEPLIAGGVMVAVAWGALAFGAVYPWAYWPLLVLAPLIGVSGLVAGRKPLPAATGFALALVALAIVVQLVPISRSLLHVLTPSSDLIRRQYDIRYAFESASWAPLTVDAERTRLALWILLAFGSLLLGLCRVCGARMVRWIAGGLAGFGALLGVAGIVQRAVGDSKLVYGFWRPVHGGDPFGPFVNHNHYAGWMVMAAPLVAALGAATLAQAPPPRERGWRGWVVWSAGPDVGRTMLIGSALVLMIVATALTLSRSGLLSLALALACLWLASRAHLGALSSRRVAWLFGVVSVTALAVTSANIVARFGETSAVTFDQRIGIWEDTLRIFNDFWLTGTGMNTYGAATLFYQRTLPMYHLAEAHNDYLQILAEGGVLVALPVLLAIGAAAVDVRRRLRQPEEATSRWLRLGAVAGLVGIAAQSLVEFSLQMPGNALLFTVLLAIALHTPRSLPADARQPARV